MMSYVQDLISLGWLPAYISVTSTSIRNLDSNLCRLNHSYRELGWPINPDRLETQRVTELFDTRVPDPATRSSDWLNV